MHRVERRKKVLMITVWLAACAAAVMLSAGIHAKYIKTVPMSGSVVFKANLAESVTLKEHKAVKNPDGTYTLQEDDVVDSNAYDVMPGVDIPKDPFITVTGKSSVPAYLYVEIVDTSPPSVKFELTSDWKELEDPRLGTRKVYVYTKTLPVTGASDPQVIPILKTQGSTDNTIIVSEEYTASAAFILNFYGYMIQKVDGKSEADIFLENYPSAPTS